MTPKEKAEELILKFMRLQEPNYNWFHSKLAKQCALIAVEEILGYMGADRGYTFWTEVKQEINKL
jgi:nitrogenase molybdenum-iron protein alpha/beta subunit